MCPSLNFEYRKRTSTFKGSVHQKTTYLIEITYKIAMHIVYISFLFALVLRYLSLKPLDYVSR